MYYSQNILYNKYKEENYERERLLSAEESNASFIPTRVLRVPKHTAADRR